MKYIKNITENTTNKNISIIRTDDWEGLYYENQLLDEGHEIAWMTILEKLGFKVEYEYFDSEKFEEYFGSNCPNTLAEVKIKLDAKKYNM